jgi:predicted CoA-substrate-specific enzyme activase
VIAAGIDSGSRTVKVAVLRRASLTPLAAVVVNQGIDQKRIVEAAFKEALRAAGLPASKVDRVVATGCGRESVRLAGTSVTEITCLARSVREELPKIKTIIDIGGQDSKVIWLDPDGAVFDFQMNDRCAAGTGRYLEMVAERLGEGLKDVGRLAAKAKLACPINSTCAVFAESEITGLLAAGTSRARIAAGVLRAIAEKTATLAGRREFGPAAFTGGVALVPGMPEALGHALGRNVIVPKRPQLAGAMGAALIGLDGR